jgi:hypothetical protein
MNEMTDDTVVTMQDLPTMLKLLKASEVALDAFAADPEKNQMGLIVAGYIHQWLSSLIDAVYAQEAIELLRNMMKTSEDTNDD